MDQWGIFLVELKQQLLQAPRAKFTKGIYVSQKKKKHIQKSQQTDKWKTPVFTFALSAATRILPAPPSFPFSNHTEFCFQAHPVLAGLSSLTTPACSLGSRLYSQALLQGFIWGVWSRWHSHQIPSLVGMKINEWSSWRSGCFAPLCSSVRQELSRTFASDAGDLG